MERFCEYCGKPIEKSRIRWERKTQFCGRDCHKEWQRLRIPKRFCEYCGKPIALNRVNARYKKQFCGRECHRLWRIENEAAEDTPRWKGGSSKYLQKKGGTAHRKLVEELLGRKLLDDEVVHHKDFNKKNNDPSNLVVMSAFDHSSMHSLIRWHGIDYAKEYDNGKFLPYINL